MFDRFVGQSYPELTCNGDHEEHSCGVNCNLCPCEGESLCQLNRDENWTYFFMQGWVPGRSDQKIEEEDWMVQWFRLWAAPEASQESPSDS